MLVINCKYVAYVLRTAVQLLRVNDFAYVPTRT